MRFLDPFSGIDRSPLVLLAVGGYGVSSEDLPVTSEGVKEFYRSIQTFEGCTMPDWYPSLVDHLVNIGAWANVTYEECKICELLPNP